jgi:CHASE3 domain sensor protein
MTVVSNTGFDDGVTAKRSHLRDMGVSILFGAVVLLVSATLLLGANISALRGNLARIDHSQQLLDKISQLEVERLSLELAVRGYALTGDKLFLRIQHEGDIRRNAALAQLERLTASEPQRALEYRKLMQDIRNHATIFDRLSEPGPDRAGTVARAILDPKLRVLKYGIRDKLVHLRSAEMRDLGGRQADITNQLSRAFFLAVGIILAAFLLGGIGVWAAQIKGPKH